MKKWVWLLILLCALPAAAGAGVNEDQALLARMETQILQLQKLNRPDFLGPALGTQLFEGRTSGLKDLSARVRAGAAQIIASLGGQAESAILWNAAVAEKDLIAQETMVVAAVSLGIRAAADPAAYAADFFTKCLNPRANFNTESLPARAFLLVLGEAKDAGMQATVAPLLALRNEAFPEDAVMQKAIDDTVKIIGFFEGTNPDDINDRFQVYNTALSSKEAGLQEWVLLTVTKQNNAHNQHLANLILNQCFAAAAPDEAKLKTLAFPLKERMDETGIPISQNSNPSFELPSGTGAYRWVCNPFNQTAYPAQEMPARSYERCLEINNPAFNSTTTVSTASGVFFGGRLPASIEYGFSDRMYYPADMAVVFDETGMSFMRNGTAFPQGTAGISLKLNLDLLNITASPATMVSTTAELTDSAPYSILSWKDLRSLYTAPPGHRIYKATLTLSVRGKVHVAVDDVFVRRSPAAWQNAPPRITALQVPGSALRGEALPFNALVSDQDADTLIGQWSSNLQGILGSPGIGITEPLTLAGNHTLCFTATDEYGLSARKTARLTVLEPSARLSASPASSISAAGVVFPVSTQVTLNLVPLNIDPGRYTYETTLYVNQQPVAAGVVLPKNILLPNGYAQVNAGLLIRNRTTQATTTAVSNTLDIDSVAQPDAGLQLASPSGGLTVAAGSSVELAVNATGITLSSVEYYLQDVATGRTSVVSKATALPFKGLLTNPTGKQYPVSYRLYAVGTGTVGGKSAVIVSNTILITLS